MNAKKDNVLEARAITGNVANDWEHVAVTEDGQIIQDARVVFGPWNVNDPLGWSRMYQVPFGPVGPSHPHECYAKHLHYECEMTLTQVAMEMKTTREHVRTLVNESCGVFTQNYIINNHIYSTSSEQR